MKLHLKAALYFVAFESAYWMFGNRFFQVLRNVVFYGDFSLLERIGDMVWFAMSGPMILVSLFCLTMTWKTLDKIIQKSTKKGCEEAN